MVWGKKRILNQSTGDSLAMASAKQRDIISLRVMIDGRFSSFTEMLLHRCWAYCNTWHVNSCLGYRIDANEYTCLYYKQKRRSHSSISMQFVLRDDTKAMLHRCMAQARTTVVILVKQRNYCN